MDVVYKGADVSGKAAVARCGLEKNLFGRADSLTIAFDDSDGAWTSWGPAPGDLLSVSEDGVKSGPMFVRSVEPSAGIVTIRAYAVKYLHAGHEEEWEGASFRRIFSQRASGLGMCADYYQAPDAVYPYVRQEGADLSFLSFRCRLEGCGLQASGGTLRAVRISSLSKAPVSNYTLSSATARTFDSAYYGSCVVTGKDARGEEVKGSAGDGSGEALHYEIKDPLSGAEEARRFAEGLLSCANATRKRGECAAGTLLRDVAPGSRIRVRCGGFTDREAVVYRVRHDLQRMRSKVWFYVTD